MYKEKYLKYKAKYLSLKKKIGGDDLDLPEFLEYQEGINDLIVSHLDTRELLRLRRINKYFYSLINNIVLAKSLKSLDENEFLSIMKIPAINKILNDSSCYDILLPIIDILNDEIVTTLESRYGNTDFFKTYENHFKWYIDSFPIPKNAVRVIQSKKMTDDYPNTMTHLMFSDLLPIDDYPQIEVLPDNIIYLKISKNFNKSVKKWPLSLRHLLFEYNSTFDQSIDNLPDSQTHLTFEFNSQFNQIVNRWPKSLKYLKFNNGSMFNQSINNLPESVTHLCLRSAFNQQVSKWPRSLEYLEVGDVFNQSIDGLPNSVKYLYIGYAFGQLVNKWPSSLAQLEFHSDTHFNNEIKNLPQTIRYIKLGRFYNRSLDLSSYENLEELHLGKKYKVSNNTNEEYYNLYYTHEFRIIRLNDNFDDEFDV